jgi:hypothetical protein
MMSSSFAFHLLSFTIFCGVSSGRSLPPTRKLDSLNLLLNDLRGGKKHH